MSFQYDASINGASVGNIRSAARVLLQELMDKREDPEDPNVPVLITQRIDLRPLLKDTRC